MENATTHQRNILVESKNQWSVYLGLKQKFFVKREIELYLVTQSL